jgi:hypothetical protein
VRNALVDWKKVGEACKRLEEHSKAFNLFKLTNLPSGTAKNLSQTRWRLLSTFMQAKFPSHETYWQKGKTKKGSRAFSAQENIYFMP